jgi:Tfp pilus assembly protein PilP
LVADAKRQLDKVVAEAASADEREKKDLAALDREASDIRNREQQALLAAQKKLQSKVDDIARRRLNIQREEQKERAEALKELQERVHRNELTRHSVDQLRVSATIKASLKANSMLTAADISGVYGEYVTRADGRHIKIRGVGPAKAQTISNWVIAAQNKARQLTPQALPQDAAAQVTQKFATRMTALSAEEQQIRQAAQPEADRIRHTAQQDQQQVILRANAVRVSAVQNRNSLRQAVESARQALTKEQWIEAQKLRDLEAFEEISFSGFLATATGIG